MIYICIYVCTYVLGISWKERKKSDDNVWTKIAENFQGEDQKPGSFMQTVMKRKLIFFGHQVRRGKSQRTSS